MNIPEGISVGLLLKFFKFGVVGFTGLLIDFGITYLCKEKLQWHKYVSNSIGFMSAVISNYFLNRIWTFESVDPGMIKQFGNFMLVSMIGLLINTFFLYLFNDRYKMNFYISKAVAVAVVMMWNFFANYLYTFAV